MVTFTKGIPNGKLHFLCSEHLRPNADWIRENGHLDKILYYKDYLHLAEKGIPETSNVNQNKIRSYQCEFK